MMSGLLLPLSSRTSAVSDPACCCSVSPGRCDRCDLLVDLEGFHLVSVARRECGLVLDIESCDRCAGCPGCGVTCSRSWACGGGGDRRALGRCSGKDPMAQTPMDMRLFAFKGVGGVGIPRSGGGSVGGSFGG